MIIMPHQDQHIQPRKATWMFKKYGINLVLRTILFALGIYYFVTDKAQLAIQNIGLSEGLNFIDIAFLFVLYDFLTKFTSRAKISIGSLKQYKFFQIPTKNTTGGTKETLFKRISEVITSGKIRSEQIHIHPKENIQSSIEEARRIVLGAKEDVSREVRHIARDLDVMRALPFDDSDLDVNSQARHILRMRRAKEIVPVAIFWVVLPRLLGQYFFGWVGCLLRLLRFGCSFSSGLIWCA